MKPFLGYDITEESDEEMLYGEEFLIDKITNAQEAMLDLASEHVDELEENAKLPLSLRIVMYGSLILGGVISGGLLSVAADSEYGITLGQMFSEMPYLFFIAAALLILFAVLTLVSRKSHKLMTESDEHINAVSKMNAAYEAVMYDFGVPKDAPKVDVLSLEFKTKNSEILIKKNEYIASLVYSAYADGENLYLVDSAEKYAFPLREFCGITTVNKSLSVIEWNKDIPHNKGEYKQYKIKEDKYGIIRFKSYHILSLEHDGEEWGIYFPCYELPTFERLTGLKAE